VRGNLIEKAEIASSRHGGIRNDNSLYIGIWLSVFVDREPFSKDNRSSPSPGLSGVIIKPKKVKI
jgi:hypothetical protein